MHLRQIVASKIQFKKSSDIFSLRQLESFLFFSLPTFVCTLYKLVHDCSTKKIEEKNWHIILKK